MSPEELKQYEDMANDYRYADSIFKPVVLKLLDEIRWLREYDEIMRNKMERISRESLECVVETEQKYKHLEEKYKRLLEQMQGVVND